MIKISKRQKEIVGLILFIFSFISILSLFFHDPTINPYGTSYEEQAKTIVGRVGVWISFYHFKILGYLSIIFPIITLIIGFILFSNKKIEEYKKILVYIFISGIKLVSFSLSHQYIFLSVLLH